jgi:membrane-bound lytic murein transglycosylase D
MSKILLLFLLCLTGIAPARADETANPFPRTAALEPQVQFWTRVYSEVDTRGGLLHDSRMMDVVYETLKFGAGKSRRTRERHVESRRRHYQQILSTLAQGKRSGLTADEQRVLSLFPDGVSNGTLRQARERIRFQLGQADRFREGIIRSGRWQPHIARVLAEHGVPYELAALPHVESSYNPAAHSHAGASGLWQFTRSTGRLFMRIDHVVDERMDPYGSSVAAARLLLANYRRTRTWPTAITAYNHGTAGMERAIRKLGTRDIARIISDYRGRSFGFASRNFYTSFLAAAEVSRNAEHYFGELSIDPAEDLEMVVTDHYYAVSTLSRVFGVGEKTLREYNASLLSPVWSGQKYVPKGHALRFPRRASGPEPELVLAQIPASETILRQRPDRAYRVHRGDTLSGIARRFGVKVNDLVALNGLRSRHQIRVGQALKLPTHDGPTTVAMVRDHDHDARKRLERPADGHYRVRRGDTLSGIAATFGVTVPELVAANELRNRHSLAIGQRLFIPGEAIEARTTYVVQRGDSLERIARKHGVSLHDLQAANRIRNRNRIHPGQLLSIPGAGPAAPADLPDAGPRREPVRYVVRRGDTLAEIARKHDVAPGRIQAENLLRNPDEIRVGQVVVIPAEGEPPGDEPSVVVAAGPETGEDEAAVSPAPLAEPEAEPAIAAAASVDPEPVLVAGVTLDPQAETPRAGPSEAQPMAGPSDPEPMVGPSDPEPMVGPSDPEPMAGPSDPEPMAGPSDPEPMAGPSDPERLAPLASDPSGPSDALPWAPDRYAVAPDGSIVVRPEETLGHYADWLELRTQTLRDLNGMAYGRPLAIGQRLRLDFAKVDRRGFERRRIDHHRVLQKAFFDDYAVAGTEHHVLRSGETLWKLSQRKYEVPVWLIQQYNPELDMNALRPGMRIAIPVVEPRAKREA